MASRAASTPIVGNSYTSRQFLTEFKEWSKDYTKVKEEIRKIDITPTLEKLYPHNSGFAECKDSYI